MKSGRWTYRINEPKPLPDGLWEGSYTLLDPEFFERNGSVTEPMKSRADARMRAQELAQRDLDRLNAAWPLDSGVDPFEMPAGC